MSKQTATIELTLGELLILWGAARSQAAMLDETFAKGESDGWYDAKAREKVSVAFWQAHKLTEKLQQLIKEMDA